MPIPNSAIGGKSLIAKQIYEIPPDEVMKFDTYSICF